MHTVLLRPYYGLTLVYCTAFSSGVLSVSFNRVILSVFLSLWSYSGLLSGLLSGLPYAVSSGLSLPRVPLLLLSPSLLSGLPPLQIRHKAYAVTLVTSLSVYRGAHSFNSWFTLWITNNG